MKNFFKLLGIILIVAMIGFSLMSCEATCHCDEGKCGTCGGTGKVPAGSTFDCPTCSGSGKCTTCDGKGKYRL